MMELPAPFPSRITSPPADRIARFLQHVDRQLAHGCEIWVYGSAAVSLYLADERSEEGFTDDIDVGAEEPIFIDAMDIDSGVVDPPLEFRKHPIEQWLVHPDWRDTCVDVSTLLGLQRLQVMILHPLDLIVTKLERAESRDIEDCTRLARRYSLDGAEAARRLDEAAECYALSERVVSQVEYSFEAVFERKPDIRRLL